MEIFKNEIKDYVGSVLKTIKTEDVIEGYSFCDFDSDDTFVATVSKYISENRELCLLNIKCLSPNRFGYGSGMVYFSRESDMEDKDLQRELVRWLEDFVNYFLYDNYNNEQWQDVFEVEWAWLVENFESETCEIEIIAPLYEFWLKYSGKLQDTFNANDVVLGWMDSQSDSNLLKNSGKESKVTEALPMPLLSRKLKIKKSDGLTDVFNDTSDLFKLNALMLRTLFNGTAHVRFMAIKCIGNLSGYMPSFLNQYYPTFEKEYDRHLTQINDSYEQQKCFKYWNILSKKDYGNWAFADTKLQENASRSVLDNIDKSHADYMYLLTEQMDRTVNLIQVLESLVGEVGSYLGEWVLEVGYTSEEREEDYVKNVKATIEYFVKLRNKYLHGSIINAPHTTDSLMRLINNRYRTIEDMHKDHELVERAVKRVLAVSFLNPDLKINCLEYFIFKYPRKKGGLKHDMVLSHPNGRELPSLVRI